MSVLEQLSVESGFHAKSTAAEVLHDIDLTGKTAIVTGGNGAIGLETTKALAAKGARVMVPVLPSEAEHVDFSGIDGDIESSVMDLADIGSVQKFVDDYSASHSSLDILINNAAVMATPKKRVGPGWELQFAINHMGHFALTTGLLPLLQNAQSARVVAVSSSAHKLSDMLWDDIQFETTPYDKWVSYGQSKTAVSLFANALARRLKPYDGHAFSVYPGAVFSPLQQHLSKEEMIALGWLGEDGEPSEESKRNFKNPEQGAATSVWTATSPLLDGLGGVYCENCDVAEIMDPNSPIAKQKGVYAYACDDEAAERLWHVSEDLLRGV